MLALALLAVAADTRPALEAAALTRRGDPAAGQLLFRSAALQCATCHTTDGTANTPGPDLSAVGGKFDRPHLVEAVLEPSRQIVEGYRLTTLAPADGRTVAGVVKAESATSLTLALPAGYRDRAILCTDFWSAYRAAVPDERHAWAGKEAGLTAHVERLW